jgi:uncharacterized membrane protein (Fun14 family)
LITLVEEIEQKSYILDILYIHHVHPYRYSICHGDEVLSTDLFTTVSATIGGGFFGGMLLGYALKKVVRLIAIVVGLFKAGLAYLQYHQVASIDWNRIETLVITLGNATSQIGSQDMTAAALAMSNFGIPLTGSMSAGFAVGFVKG